MDKLMECITTLTLSTIVNAKTGYSIKPKWAATKEAPISL